MNKLYHFLQTVFIDLMFSHLNNFQNEVFCNWKEVQITSNWKWVAVHSTLLDFVIVETKAGATNWYNKCQLHINSQYVYKFVTRSFWYHMFLGVTACTIVVMKWGLCVKLTNLKLWICETDHPGLSLVKIDWFWSLVSALVCLQVKM